MVLPHDDFDLSVAFEPLIVDLVQHDYWKVRIALLSQGSLDSIEDQRIQVPNLTTRYDLILSSIKLLLFATNDGI